MLGTVVCVISGRRIGCEIADRLPVYEKWWACRDLNPEPRDYESPALTVELQALPLSQCDTATGQSSFMRGCDEGQPSVLAKVLSERLALSATWRG